jgi:hypothetical protein
VRSSSRVRGFDFSVPEQFLRCLWKAQFGPHPDPAIRKQFWHRDLSIVKRNHAALFDPNGGDEAALAANSLIAGISEGKHPRGETKCELPREWLYIFHEAFEAGLIGAAAWGKAARLTFCASDSPLGGSQAVSTASLKALRATSPGTFMSAQERLLWLSLPAIVTLYRGSYVSSIEEGAHGLSWTPDPKLAATYAQGRAVDYYRHNPQGDALPMLVEARVPKSAVIGVVILPTEAATQYELLIDFEKVPASAFRQLGQVECPREREAMRQQYRAFATDPRVLAAAA